MNKQARGLILVIGGALLATACAPTGVTSYTGQKVAAPTKKMTEEVKTKADHEALAVYYEREAQALHEKAKYYQQMAIRVAIGEVPTGCFTRPAMKPSRRSTTRPRKRI